MVMRKASPRGPAFLEEEEEEDAPIQPERHPPNFSGINKKRPASRTGLSKSRSHSFVYSASPSASGSSASSSSCSPMSSTSRALLVPVGGPIMPSSSITSIIREARV